MGDEYLPLDKYVNKRTKMRFKHKKCGRSFLMLPSYFLQGGRCLQCLKQHRLQTKEKLFLQRVKSLVGKEYAILSEYKGNTQKLEFMHKKCGYIFYMLPISFLRGQRCPFCAGNIRKTDAQFKAEVKSVAGSEYLVLGQYKNAKVKIKFKHQKCGKIFLMQPCSFLRGQRCPECMQKKVALGRRKTPHDFKLEFYKVTGKEYILVSDYKSSLQKISVLHLKCGCLYKVLPTNFLNGHRCPICSKRLKEQKFQLRISKMGDNKYIPLQPYQGTQQKMLMLHKTCGRKYYVQPGQFFIGCRCPFCRASKGEKAVAKYLEDNEMKFDRQFIINDCKDKLPLPFDFAVFNKDKSINCLIEYQGAQHFINPFEYKKEKGPFNTQNILNTQKHDAMKLQYCKDHGIKLIRINHPQTSSKSNSVEFIRRLVNRTLNRELHVV